jgi:hypothetical protein
MHLAANTPRESHAEMIRPAFRNWFPERYARMTLNAFRVSSRCQRGRADHAGPQRSVFNLANIADRPIAAKSALMGSAEALEAIAKRDANK